MNFLFYSVHVVKLLIAFQVLNSRIRPAFVCLTRSPALAFYVGPWKWIGGWHSLQSPLSCRAKRWDQGCWPHSWGGCPCFLWMSSIWNLHYFLLKWLEEFRSDAPCAWSCVSENFKTNLIFSGHGTISFFFDWPSMFLCFSFFSWKSFVVFLFC